MTAAAGMVLAIVLFLLWLFAPIDPVEARYQHSDCRRVTLIDAATGSAIRGTEDLALLPDGDSLIVSAHDRRDATQPDGGLYRVSLWGIRNANRYDAENLIDTLARTDSFRPHGIAVSKDGGRLAVINRQPEGQALIEIGDLRPNGWIASKRLTGTSLCRANDLNFVTGDVETLEITLDRKSCGISASDLMPGSTTGRTVLWDGGRLHQSRADLAFPNGIAGPYIAETRKDRILRPAGEPIRLPGGPDNLTREDSRTLLVAMHPGLRRLWLHLNGLWPTAPSRIARVDVLSSAVDVLFDDPSGELFSGATSAIFAKGMLIAGSVTDEGLLICQQGDR
jgi:DNA-binding beta-propeller fold protein YncE